MRGGDEEIAATRQELLARRTDPETKQAEQDEARQEARRTVEERRTRLGLPTEPGKSFDRSAAGVGKGLG